MKSQVIELIKDKTLDPNDSSKSNLIGNSTPIFVKIRHKKDAFIIYSDEFKKSGLIKEELSKIKDVPLENIKLFYSNKRLIEDHSTNHDQQIKHTCLLYAVFKNPDNNEWENINDIINFTNL